MMRSRRGFSFIELLVVMIFIGLIVRIAIPRYTDMKRRAIAGEIVGDVHTIRVAAYTYYTEKSVWPPDYASGVVPTELIPYLPQNFSFSHADFEYDFEVWNLSGGTPSNPQQDQIIGLSVNMSDTYLAQQLMKIVGKGYVPFSSGNKVTLFLSGVSGN